MSRVMVPALQVGNEFLISKPEKQKMKVEVITPEASLQPQPIAVAAGAAEHGIEMPVEISAIAPNAPSASTGKNHWHIPSFNRLNLPHLPRSTDFLRIIKRHPVAIGACIVLMVGSVAIIIGGRYWANTHIVNHASAATTVKVGTRPISGLNTTIPAAEYQSHLNAITNQAATLTIGTNTIPVSSSTIRSWLQVTSNKSKSEYYIHLNKAAIAPSLTKLANKYVKSPINQVTVTEDGVNRVAVGGRNGTALSDPNSLNLQAQQLARTVMDGKGLQFNTPLQTVPFQAVTAANFDKLLVADINTKKMWAFQNGQLVKTILVSAGAPATPTPIGQYKIYAKFSTQDMRGNNPNGTPYFQPRVPWISYFSSGNAVHGVYWHGDNWFGHINSSHGCLGTKVDEAKWVYDWAPVGTTVITHT